MATMSSADQVERREREQHEAAIAEQEKQNHTTVNTLEVSEESLQTQWTPGVKARFPWLGFMAVCVMLLGIAFTVVILKTSEGKKQEEWPVQITGKWAQNKWTSKAKLKPSSALAGVNTIFNIALAIAIANGVTIAWWRKALRGATVQDLHRSWAFSTSVFELLTAGKAFNIIALCALTAKFALLDGIFLQQASGTEPGFWDEFNVTGFQFPIVNKDFPMDFLGSFSEDAQEGAYSGNLSAALFNYYMDPNLIAFDQVFVTDTMERQFDTKCIGSCDFTVSGFGLEVLCTQEDSLLSDITPASLGSSNTTNASSTLVDVSFVPYFGGSNDTTSEGPSIDMHVEYAINTDKNPDEYGAPISTHTDCQGSLTRQTCTIRPAIVDYRIYVTNSSAQSVGGSRSGIQIQQPILQDTTNGFMSAVSIDLIQPLYVKSAPLTLDPASRTMQAIYRLLNTTYTTHITQSYTPATGFAISTGAGQMGSWWGKLQSANSFPTGCSITLTDPSQWIITQLNNILFRAAVTASTDRDRSSATYRMPFADDIQRDLVGNQSVDTITYTSNYAWMGGAVAIMALCILCVLPVYWGFWELGRKVTLGPMEIASAFQAPVLSTPKATAAGGEVKTLLKEVGSRQVRYGEVDGQLVVAETAATRRIVGQGRTVV